MQTCSFTHIHTYTHTYPHIPTYVCICFVYPCSYCIYSCRCFNYCIGYLFVAVGTLNGLLSPIVSILFGKTNLVRNQANAIFIDGLSVLISPPVLGE